MEGQYKQKEAHDNPNPNPNQMEGQYKQKEAHEEARKREALKNNRARFAPVDFAEMRKEADEQRKLDKEAWDEKHKV